MPHPPRCSGVLMRVSYSQQPLVHEAVGRFRPRRCSNHAKCPRVPTLRRSAIHASGIVIRDRNCPASSPFFDSPFRRVLRAASLQRIRLSPATTNRSACTASPKWLGPGPVSPAPAVPAETPPHPDTSLFPPAWTHLVNPLPAATPFAPPAPAPCYELVAIGSIVAGVNRPMLRTERGRQRA